MDTVIRQADRGRPPRALRTGRARHDRVIEGHGTPERAWQAWPTLAEVPLLALDALVPSGRRAVVVAPHPDDEVLACGGLLAMLLARHRNEAHNNADHPPVAVVAVTDGEASHPGSARWAPDRLAAQRRAERTAGLGRLGGDTPVIAAGIADGAVAASEDRLVDVLRGVLSAGDVVLTTWRLDGHPDHEATGRACARAALLNGCRLIEVPVWAWHWAQPGDVRVPWHRLRRVPLDARALDRKRDAIDAHRTQLLPDGDRPPVLFAGAVDRLMRPFEYVFIPEDQA